MFFSIKLGSDQREIMTVRLVQIQKNSSKKTHSFYPIRLHACHLFYLLKIIRAGYSHFCLMILKFII